MYPTHFSGQQRAYVGSHSPDGRWIVYRLEDHGQFALMRMRPDGSDVRTILPLLSFRPRSIDWGARTPDEADESLGDS
ncbi:MAG: hypothetical protein QOJ85_3447 [Solirubrobacteraceae bacterium]|jgi:Tol biopolymer transport system component|nr:hypothetical protein [Solirubrobacteraceae bacterium]MEA2242172.1 hypothetical protein [Solirubrobacteraceae bacterium]